MQNLDQNQPAWDLNARPADPLTEEIPVEPRPLWPRLARAALVLLLIGAVSLVAYLAYLRVTRVDAATHLARGEQAMQSGRTQDAIIHFKNALQVQPDDRSARLALARAYLRAREFGAAEKELETARKLGAKEPDIAHDLIRAVLGRGDFEKALGLIETQLASGDQWSALRILEAQARVAKGEIALAEAALSAAIPIDLEERVSLTVAQGQLAMATGELDVAAARMEEALKLDSKNSGALAVRAQVRAYRGDPKGAETDYRDLLAVNPEYLPAKYALGELLVRQGRSTDAKPILNDLEKSAPRNPATHYLLGVAAYLGGDLEEASVALNRVLTVRPTDQRVLGMLADIAFKREQFGQAEELMRRLLELAPDNLEVVKRLATFLVQNRRADEAVVLLAGHEQAGMRDAAYWGLRAYALGAAGDARGAERTLARAAQIAPDSPLLRQRRALDAFAKGELDAAITDLKALVDAGDTGRSATALVYAYLAAGDLESAQNLARDLSAKPGDDATDQVLLGVSYLAAKDNGNARAAFDAALKADPRSVPALYNLGELELREGRMAQAGVQFKAVLKHDAKFTPAYLRLAQLAVAEGNENEATRLLRQAVVADPGNSAAWGALAEQAQRAGRSADAVKIFREAVAAAPWEHQLKLGLARALNRTGGHAEAIELLSAVEAPEAESVAFKRELARARMLKGDIARARVGLQELLTANPADAESALMLIKLDKDAGRPEVALARARKFRRLFPEDARGLMAEGEVLLAAERYDEAVTALSAIEQESRSAAVTLMYALALAKSGNLDAARAEYRNWLVKHPRDRSARLLLATFETSAGDRSAAIEEYETLLRADPDDPIALNSLAYQLIDSDLKRALELAERAHRVAPDSYAVADTLGWILVKSGQVSRGLSLLEKARRSAPSDRTIHYHFAAGQAEAGEKTFALQELATILATTEPFAERAQAEALRQRLAETATNPMSH